MSYEKTNENNVILDVQNLKKFFISNTNIFKRSQYIKAVNDISFQLEKGETYALVGESGCGKSTTGRTILQLTEPTSGKAFYKNKNIFQFNHKELRNFRKKMQIVFQDPYSSLNSRKRIGSTLEEPLKIHKIGTKKERTKKVKNIMEKVGLQLDHYHRFSHEFSGGQRQRIGLARALIMNPEIIICDEPVSALDVAIQSQIINLLQNLQKEMKLTYLFVSHDISVVRHMSDRIGVMYLGKIVEEGTTDDVINDPLHPYTQSLLSAVPSYNSKKKKERIILKGEIPSPVNPPHGCVFHTRCPFAMDICKKEVPKATSMGNRKTVSCHLYN